LWPAENIRPIKPKRLSNFKHTCSKSHLYSWFLLTVMSSECTVSCHLIIDAVACNII
jgi:hypothetical protein